jgi:sensor histidine kinase YesM
MKKRVVILIMQIFVCTVCVCQNSKIDSLKKILPLPYDSTDLPPAYEITIDTSLTVTLNETYWQMLQDADAKLTISDVSGFPLASRFHLSSLGIKGYDNSISTYWFRYRLKNNLTHDAKIAIQRNATSADLYTPGTNGQWDRKITGTGVPWDNMDGLKRISTVTYTLPPGQELLIYERDYYGPLADKPSAVQIDFGYTDKVLQKYFSQEDPSMLPSFLFGLLVLAALFNIYFFLIVHERVYLFFSLMLLGRGFSRFIEESYIFLPGHPVARWYVMGVLGMVYFFFLVHFVRYFLETFKYTPRWDRFLIFLGIYIIAVTVLPMNFLHHEPFAGIVMLFILVTFILFIRSPNKAIRWRVVMIIPGICILLIPLFLYIFSSFKGDTVKQTSPFIEGLDNHFAILEEISLIWLLIFFSWDLFQRYHKLQKQIGEEKFAKERLAKEREIERSQLLAQRAELEMQALRAQMNPHFIFNSLNSINRFILQNNKAEATEYLTKFSRLIRIILNSSANATVSLAEDTEALQLYLELERLRCEEKFNFKIKCDDELDADDIQVPPMLLQPFVENAIWHGLTHKESEGHLLINIKQENSTLVCIIADDGVGRKRSAELKNKSGHKSMGMKITESRIAMIKKMSGENKSIEIRDLVDADGNAAGTEVILKIPVEQA